MFGFVADSGNRGVGCGGGEDDFGAEGVAQASATSRAATAGRNRKSFTGPPLPRFERPP